MSINGNTDNHEKKALLKPLSQQHLKQSTFENKIWNFIKRVVHTLILKKDFQTIVKSKDFNLAYIGQLICWHKNFSCFCAGKTSNCHINNLLLLSIWRQLKQMLRLDILWEFSWKNSEELCVLHAIWTDGWS